MSGDRVELGLGTGWYRESTRRSAYRFPPLGERFDRLAEQLEIITGLWYRIRVRSRVQLRRQALPRRGEPQRPDRRSARTRRSSSVAPDRSARPPSRPGSPTSSTAPSATTCARPSRGSTRPASGSAATRPGPPLGRAPRGLRDHPGRVTRRAGVIGSELIRRHAAIGSPALVADRIEEQRKAGADTIYFHIYDIEDLDHIALLGAKSCAKWGSPVSQQATEKSAPPAGTIHPRRDARAAPRLGAHRAAPRPTARPRGPGRSSTRPGCATPTTTSPRAMRWCACRWWAGTRAPAWWSRSARTSSGSSPATGWSAPTSRPAASAGPARPGTRTCATRARTPGPACSPTVRSASTKATRTSAASTLGTHLPVRGRAGWACIKLPDDIPFEIGSLVGCGGDGLGLGRVRGGVRAGTPW